MLLLTNSKQALYSIWKSVIWFPAQIKLLDSMIQILYENPLVILDRRTISLSTHEKSSKVTWII